MIEDSWMIPDDGQGWVHPSDQAESARLDEVGSWLSLEQAAARCGVAPNQLKQLGEAGVIETQTDRGGRLRISPAETRFVRRHKNPLYKDLPDERWPS